MDNIAHTLVGAALGRAVADHRAPAPALLGAFAANVPDIAELFLGLRPGRRSDYITLHRGITHSLIGALVEVALLTLAAGTVATWWARRRGPAAPSWRWILARLGPACVAVSIAGLAGWALPRLGPGVRRTAAAWSCAILAVYTLAQAGVSSGAKRTTRAAARERFGADAQWATLTDVGRPFTW